MKPQVRAGADTEGFAIQRNRLPPQPAIPVPEHGKQRETAAEILMNPLGAPHRMWAAFTQAQQAGAVIDLAVEQHHASDGAVTQAAGRLQRRKALELRADVWRSIAQHPVLPVVTQGNRGLRATPGPQAAIAHTGALAAIAVPLRETTAGGGTENADVHGGCSRRQARPTHRLAG
ncbi:hypothetical protein D3C76_1246070 [compost metagenome]